MAALAAPAAGAAALPTTRCDPGAITIGSRVEVQGLNTCITRKGPEELVGTVWRASDDMVLDGVNGGSAAERAGMRDFIGQRLTHVNGTLVWNTSHARRVAQGGKELTLCFAEAGLHSAKWLNGALGVVVAQKGEDWAVRFGPPHAGAPGMTDGVGVLRPQNLLLRFAAHAAVSAGTNTVSGFRFDTVIVANIADFLDYFSFHSLPMTCRAFRALSPPRPLRFASAAAAICAWWRDRPIAQYGSCVGCREWSGEDHHFCSACGECWCEECIGVVGGDYAYCHSCWIN